LPDCFGQGQRTPHLYRTRASLADPGQPTQDGQQSPGSLATIAMLEACLIVAGSVALRGAERRRVEDLRRYRSDLLSLSKVISPTSSRMSRMDFIFHEAHAGRHDAREALHPVTRPSSGGLGTGRGFCHRRITAAIRISLAHQHINTAAAAMPHVRLVP
jgi:hypothetical protein